MAVNKDEKIQELEKELEDYEVIFNSLRPFLFLALDNYYVGDSEEKEQIKSKLEQKGLTIQ